MTVRRATWSAGLLFLTSGLGCPTPQIEPRPPVELALQFVARQSCGRLSALDYDTSCLAALYVRARDASGSELYERCIALDTPPADLGELLRGEPLIRFSGLSTNRAVRFEVRGLHDTGLSSSDRAVLCDSTAQSDQWLFWGESDLMDLTQFEDGAGPDGPRIPVIVDCRDCSEDCGANECFGCSAISPDAGASCPATFPPSVCAPSSALVCGIPCDTDQDCFEGARRCVDDVCEADDTSGTLCSLCTADGGPACAEGLSCVRRPPAATGFCAPACPDNRCVTGMKCNRLYNDLVPIP